MLTLRRVQSLSLLWLVGGLMACSPTGVPLAGDETSQSLCPSSGCVDPTPQSVQLSISYGGSINRTSVALKNTAGTPIDFVEFSGECYASTYPQNEIRVTVKKGTVKLNMTVGTEDSRIVSLVSNDLKPRCVQGRYAFGIRGDAMPPGASYSVSVAIAGIDEDGKAHLNSSTGAFQSTVIRTNPPN